MSWQDNQVTGWNTYAALFQPWQETVITYTYDPLYRLTEAAYDGTLNANYQYAYDAVGNMTFFTETVGTETTRVQRYFNAANQLIDSFDYVAGTTSFFYDGNGNLITQIPPGGYIDIWYRYNQRNLLTTQGHSQLAEEITDATFAYDGAGNRLQQVDYTTGGLPVTITYTNDILGLSQVLVADDGTTQTYNLFGLDLISQDNGTDTRYLLADGLGSVRTEMIGDAIETLTTYEPFGKVIAQTGSDGTVYGFTGEQADAATGLVYLRGRYYSPSLKIFLSRDPFPGVPTIPATLHPYTYAHNNPVNLTDPSGEFVPQVVVGVVAAVAVVIVIYVAQDAIRDALTPAIDSMSRAISDFADGCIDIFINLRERIRVRPGIDDAGGREGVREHIGPAVWQAPRQQPQTQQGPTPFPQITPLPPLPDWPNPTPSPTPQAKKVLVVGDGNFEYSTNLALNNPDWQITGTSYGNGSNTQTFISSYGNLTLYTNVDATRLESGTITGNNRYDAVVYNAPRADLPLLPKGPHGDFVDNVARSAFNVLNPGGQMRFSVSGGMSATPRLYSNWSKNRTLGYSSIYRVGYYADPYFGVYYQPRSNEGEPLESTSGDILKDMFWYVYVK